MEIGNSISGAVFSDSNRRYRYALWRIWNKELPKLMFVGLNPSTANEFRNDPTITRVCGFAKTWGFGGLFGSNLHPYVTAYPKELWLNRPIEQDELNDIAIGQMRDLSAVHMVGWGNEGHFAENRPTQVLKLLGELVFCLKVTKLGEPSHPLYFPSESKLIPYIRK